MVLVELPTRQNVGIRGLPFSRSDVLHFLSAHLCYQLHRLKHSPYPFGKRPVICPKPIHYVQQQLFRVWHNDLRIISAFSSTGASLSYVERRSNISCCLCTLRSTTSTSQGENLSLLTAWQRQVCIRV